MKKLLFALVLIGGAVFLLLASQDVRSVLGWLLTGYLIFRAAPGIGRDFRNLRQLSLFSGRRISFRRSKVDTL
jgi:hypothetical protein